ncbi:isoprenylcysteine carboxyl methyltransferase family protein [Bacillus solitudinis]|uniref:isoprenylcysteine carboxyl methyltransferase family protein n=1 Tax=Bacillus solitudinis TaxID=2014074 RepID=UPI000C23A5F4|nr:isoprenylcysteine carboxyl methyltransferase family protein [Bacillus solitudinis]
MTIIYLLIAVVIVQRLIELKIASQNAKWIVKQGGYEVGKDHYKFIVAVHTLFFVALLIEILLFELTLTLWSFIPFGLFVIAQFGRVWALTSLGKFWNTRIMILPGARVVAKGPYRFMKHPNYVIVVVEIVALPLMFQAYLTALVFTMLNAVVLYVRIREEELALEALTNYKEVFSNRRRFVPRYED